MHGYNLREICCNYVSQGKVKQDDGELRVKGGGYTLGLN